MPHDKNGQELKEGDIVVVECVVKSVSPNTDYCNCTVETTAPMYPGNTPSCFTLNTKQVEKPCCEDEDPPSVPPEPPADSGLPGAAKIAGILIAFFGFFCSTATAQQCCNAPAALRTGPIRSFIQHRPGIIIPKIGYHHSGPGFQQCQQAPADVVVVQAPTPVQFAQQLPRSLNFGVVGCLNCTTCQANGGCSCPGGNFYCADGVCPVGGPRVINPPPTTFYQPGPVFTVGGSCANGQCQMSTRRGR